MSNRNFDEYEQDQEMLEQRRQRRTEMKRKRKMQQRIILGVAAVVLILVIVLLFKGCSKNNDTTNKNNDIITPPTQDQEQVPDPVVEPDRKATLAAVGDIMLYDTQLADAQQADQTYDFTDCFSAVSPYTMSADLTVGNLELNMTDSTPYAGKPYWNAPESFANTLADLGFDVMLTANTYSITNGINGLASTAKFLNTAGIDNVGTHITDPGQAGGAVLREVNGIKIAFIGFTKGVDGRTLPANNEYAVDLLYTDYNGAYSKINTSGILQRIDDAKALNPDIIVAMVHWGGEYELEVTDSQKDITDLLLKNDVDVILGTHSHVVGPMGFVDVKNNDGDQKHCFVAYSLGNFVADMDKDYTMDSVILNLEFTKSGETGETTISAADYTPLYILDAGEGTDVRFQVLPIRKAVESKLFEQYEDQMNQAIEDLKTNTQMDASNPVYFDSGK